MRYCTGQTTDSRELNIYKTTLRLNDDGTISPPGVPGIGIDPNYEALDQYRVR